MNRKMTLFALAAKWAGFGASGLALTSAADAGLKKPSAVSNPVSATPVNPAPASQRNSRRVRRQNWRILCESSCMGRLAVVFLRSLDMFTAFAQRLGSGLSLIKAVEFKGETNTTSALVHCGFFAEIQATAEFCNT